jgi:hypothetical protein
MLETAKNVKKEKEIKKKEKKSFKMLLSPVVALISSLSPSCFQT